jgi:hypothetical protein
MQTDYGEKGQETLAMLTFNEVLLACCKKPELIKEFDRLSGTNVMGIFHDKRPPIIRMIDESTGYQKVLDQKAHDDMQKFISFVFECVWMRLPEIQDQE